MYDGKISDPKEHITSVLMKDSTNNNRYVKAKELWRLPDYER